MDLRMCPACNQSVLDDEAQECPFCGAAMDGSSGPKKAPPQTQKKSAAESSPAATKDKQAPPAEKKKPEKSSDDPFPSESKPTAKKKVIPLRRKPTSKASYRVVCPMCDTNGFATPAVAGKEVKCPNPDCMLPVFTAPEMEKEEPEEEKKPLLTPVRIFSLVAVLVMAGIGGYFYSQIPPEPDEPDYGEGTPAGNNGGIGVGKNGTEEDDNEEPVKPDTPPQPDPVDVAAFQDMMMKAAINSALQRNNNRSKPFCRQLNAMSFVALGEIARAQGQLDAFDKLESNLNHFKIPPLVRVGWQQLEGGNRNAAAEMADQALQYTDRLPRAGNDSIRYAITLSSFLIALERYDEVRNLIERREDVKDITQAAARLSMAIEDKSYRLDETYRWLSEISWSSPLAFAAAYSAVMHGYQPQAATFVASLEDSAQKGEALAGMAAAQALISQRNETEFTADQLPAIEGISEQSRTMALAQALQCLPQGESREQLAGTLAETAAQWKIPEPAQVPDFRGIYDGNVTYDVNSQHEVIFTHLLLARHDARKGNGPEAWQHLQQVFLATATIGPALETTDALVAEIENSRNSLQSRLARELNLDGVVEERSAFNQYRANAFSIAEAAEARFDLETKIYQESLEWGLVKPLYENVLQENSASGNPNLDLIIERTLAPDLLYSLQQMGNQQAVEQFKQDWPATEVNKAPLKTKQELSRLVEAGNVAQIRVLLRRLDQQEREPLMELRYACEMAQQQSPQTVLKWIEGMSVVEREMAYRLSAVFMTRRGEIENYWEATQNRNLSATDRCSLILGLAEGLATTDVYDQPEAAEGKEAAE